ncbi:MAG: TldD/PmbA family protein [Lachnospiraceae bacterium]|nr:TldD/PmbA family protein [Lachnospiraceae bacterium]
MNKLLVGMDSLFDTSLKTELKWQENRYRNVNFNCGNLVYNNRSEVSGVYARVCKNGMYGSAATSECSEEKVKEVLKAASNNALFMDRHAKRNDYKSIVVPNGTIALNRPIIDTEQKKIIDVCRQVDEYIVKNYPNLKSRYVGYNEESMEKELLVSEGKSGHTTVPRCNLYVGMTAETKDGTPVELGVNTGGYGCFDDYYSKLDEVYKKVDELYIKVMAKSEGVRAEAGYKTVILGGILGGMLSHEAVGHTVEADLVKNGSVAGPSLGKMVASEMVNLVDFAHTFNGETAPLPVYLDDEGVEAKDAVIIKDGKLVGYMNNKELAAYYDMEPTGNARGWEYMHDPIIRMRNTTILPGQDKLEEMIASVDDGYYLLETNNGQADLTGEFMFGVTFGYEIKKGKLGRAILDTTVSGMAFDMLKTVDMISDKVYWCTSGMCGKGQAMMVAMGGPEIRCKIMLGGN